MDKKVDDMLLQNQREAREREKEREREREKVVSIKKREGGQFLS